MGSNSLSSDPAPSAHSAWRSVLQSSVSTNDQCGGRANVRVLLVHRGAISLPVGGQRAQGGREEKRITTDLTPPLPSSPTPLHPSLRLVHALLSPVAPLPVLKYDLPHPPPPPFAATKPQLPLAPSTELEAAAEEAALALHRSFSQSSTSLNSEAQCRSSSLSSSIFRASAMRSFLVFHPLHPLPLPNSRKRGTSWPLTNGWVIANTPQPPTKARVRRGKTGKRKRRAAKLVTARTNTICGLGLCEEGWW